MKMKNKTPNKSVFFANHKNLELPTGEVNSHRNNQTNAEVLTV